VKGFEQAAGTRSFIRKRFTGGKISPSPQPANLNHKQFVELVAKHSRSHENQRRTDFHGGGRPNDRAPGLRCATKKSLEQVQILCGSSVASDRARRKRFASYVLNTLLGGWNEVSRLFQNIS